MAQSTKSVPVYLEIGKKRTFACAIDWPGWCRSGRDEVSALQALYDYAPRYANALSSTNLGFQIPGSKSTFSIIERLPGNATTDFGAPGIPPAADLAPVDPSELKRFQTLLKACWSTFDLAAHNAAGQPLRSGPRGGGRNLEEIVRHLMDAEDSYLSRLGRNLGPSRLSTDDEVINLIHNSVLIALDEAVHGRINDRGPRGGIHWTPRYFVRRVAWHVLDHAWEIEDRMTIT